MLQKRYKNTTLKPNCQHIVRHLCAARLFYAQPLTRLPHTIKCGTVLPGELVENCRNSLSKVPDKENIAAALVDFTCDAYSYVKITLTNLQMHAHHGVLPEEQVLGGRFALDIDLHYNADQAADSDDLHHAVDYGRVAAVAEAIIRKQRFKLIEALAARIVEDLLQMFPRLDAVGLRLRKHNLPLEQLPDYVQVEHYKARNAT